MDFFAASDAELINEWAREKGIYYDSFTGSIGFGAFYGERSFNGRLVVGEAPLSEFLSTPGLRAVKAADLRRRGEV